MGIRSAIPAALAVNRHLTESACPRWSNFTPPRLLTFRGNVRLSVQQKCHIQLMENVMTPKEQTRLKIPFDEWTEVFGLTRRDRCSQVSGAASRPTHSRARSTGSPRVHILEMNGESYRLRESRIPPFTGHATGTVVDSLCEKEDAHSYFPSASCSAAAFPSPCTPTGTGSSGQHPAGPWTCRWESVQRSRLHWPSTCPTAISLESACPRWSNYLTPPRLWRYIFAPPPSP